MSQFCKLNFEPRQFITFYVCIFSWSVNIMWEYDVPLVKKCFYLFRWHHQTNGQYEHVLHRKIMAWKKKLEKRNYVPQFLVMIFVVWISSSVKNILFHTSYQIKWKICLVVQLSDLPLTSGSKSHKRRPCWQKVVVASLVLEKLPVS